MQFTAETFDWSSTIKDTDFTRKANQDWLKVVNDEDFDEMESSKIFDYLARHIEIVPFNRQLKRYLYRKACLTQPFAEVRDEEYFHILQRTFDQNYAPYSFQSTSTTPRQTLNNLLTAANVRRDKVFLLGFGLKMSDKEVEDFLQKALCESSFDFTNPDETLYWYCYRYQKPYKTFLALHEAYNAMTPPNGKIHDLPKDPKKFIRDEKKLMDYLRLLKFNPHLQQDRAQTREVFASLLDQAKKQASWLMVEGSADSTAIPPEKVTLQDVESLIYCAIPRSGNNNLVSKNQSSLQSYFSKHRLTRQRMDSLIKGNLRIDRNDLITLMFFIRAQDIDADPAERTRSFIRDTNAILNQCGMAGVYLVNPYETFILICMVSDIPADTFSGIWEEAYSTSESL